MAHFYPGLRVPVVIFHKKIKIERKSHFIRPIELTDVRTRPRTARTLPQMVPEQVSNDPTRSNPPDRNQSDDQTRSLWFNFMRNVARSRLIWGTALIAVVTTAVAVTFLVTQFGYNQVLAIILFKRIKNERKVFL